MEHYQRKKCFINLFGTSIWIPNRCIQEVDKMEEPSEDSESQKISDENAEKKESQEPTEPAEAPDEPAEAPDEPAEAPEEPAEAPEEPAEAPEEPAEAPEEPAEAPEEPAEAPEEPAEAPEEPAEAPEEPAEAPEEPAEAPEEPAEAPEEPADAPEEPAETSEPEVKEIKPKKKRKSKPKEPISSDAAFDDVGGTSLGLGPSEFTQPVEEPVVPEVKAPVVETEISPEEEEFGLTIFAIKTAIGHEKMVADRISSRARKRKFSVHSLLSPTKLRGYVLVECVNNRDAVKDLIKGLEHVRNVVDGETTLDEIEHFLTPKPLVFGIMEGDIVEIISGPFKGEKAKVQQIDESKEEITVELFEAMVSIPVTIRGDHVRVLEKEKESA
jgi:transcriptional antiterminator NusG